MQQIAGGAGIQQQQQRPGKVQLGKFWPQAPNAWFAAVELKFEVANINSERELFAHSVGAMGFNILRAATNQEFGACGQNLLSCTLPSLCWCC